MVGTSAALMFKKDLSRMLAVTAEQVLLENPKFHKAMAFAAESLPLIEMLSDYVKGIKVD
jgi:hypothetical protein